MIRFTYNQRGQSMVAMVIVLLAALLSMLAVIDRFRTIAKESVVLNGNREVAMALAQSGFNDAQAWFQRQQLKTGLVSGLGAGGYQYLSYSSSINGFPYAYPDGAFIPVYSLIQNNTDTDVAGDTWNVFYWNGNTLAAAIIRDIPIHISGSTSVVNNIWGRYVIKRQVVCNWCPGSNTCNAATDPDACHDISDQKCPVPASVNAARGSGSIWSITSKAYVYQSLTRLADFNSPTYFEGNSYLNAPKKFITVGGLPVKLLLAQSTYYGELYGLTYNGPKAAVAAASGANISIDDTVLTGETGTATGDITAAVARADSNPIAIVTPGAGASTFTGVYTSWPAPTVGGYFGGYSKTDLYNFAEQKGTNITMFPDRTQANWQNQAGGTFYYLAGSAEFFPMSYTAASGIDGRWALKGSGLLFVDGNLTVDLNADASWTGVIWVNGNVVAHVPFDFAGTLVATGTIKIYGDTNVGKASVIYSSAAVASAQKYFTNYRINKATIEWSNR